MGAPWEKQYCLQWDECHLKNNCQMKYSGNQCNSQSKDVMWIPWDASITINHCTLDQLQLIYALQGQTQVDMLVQTRGDQIISDMPTILGEVETSIQGESLQKQQQQNLVATNSYRTRTSNFEMWK